MIAPNPSYHEGKTETLVIYDVRILSIAERFHRERAAWGEFGDVEALDKDHYVLRIQPGVARELAS